VIGCKLLGFDWANCQSLCIYLDVDYLKYEILEMDRRLEGVIDDQ